MGITVLLPGGFKPPHGGHLQLANSYAKNSKVDKVLVLIGPSKRDGIGAEESTKIWKMLPTDKKVEVIAVDSENPMAAAFDYVLNMDNNATGEIAMAASSKGDDAKRSDAFVKAIEKYKTSSTKDGRFAPKKITPVKLPIDVSPLLYKGRNDKYDGTGISASVLRKDLEDEAKDEFLTNYPNVDKNVALKIFDLLMDKKKHISEIIVERAVLSTILRSFLVEGGNAIPTSIEVDKEDVKQVIKDAISYLPKELRNSLQINIGSSGYKAKSGDIDVFIDEDAVIDFFGAENEKVAKKELERYLADKGLESKTIGRNVHVGIPYKDAKAQVDFMVIKDSSIVAPWHQHGPRKSYEDPEFKGKDLFILLNSIGKSLGLKFDPFGAKLLDRETGESIARNRDEVAKILLNPNASENDLNSVKSVLKALENDPKRDKKLAQAKEDEKKGLIKLSFNNINENILLEAASARIQHPEDLIYWEGSKGAQRALQIIDKASSDPSTTSVKWDGSPAVVFGVDEKGNFILTDKGGFVAKGYDGKTKQKAWEKLTKFLRTLGQKD
jgi:hypothetical protein